MDTMRENMQVVYVTEEDVNDNQRWMTGEALC